MMVMDILIAMTLIVQEKVLTLNTVTLNTSCNVHVKCNDRASEYGNCCDDYEELCASSGEGCMDPNATNYNPNAIVMSGSYDYGAYGIAEPDQTVDFGQQVTLSGSGYSALE